MGVIKVETFDVDVAATPQTYTLTNDVGSLASAFVRNTNPRGHSGGPVGSTANADPDDMSGYGFLSATDEITFGRLNGTVKMAGEVWRYTGAPGGADEFIVRDRVAVTLTGAGPSTGNAVSGIVDRNRCVAFITGKTCTQNNRNNSAEMGAIAYLDASGDLTVERGSGTSTLVVYVTVVEFTGVNWSVGYAQFGFTDGNKTLYLDSQGNTGSVATVDWNTSLIIEARQSGGNGANDAIEDMAFVASPGAATSVNVATDSGSANTGDGFVYVLTHPNMTVGRTINSKTISNNNSYVTENFPPGLTLTALDESCVEWTVTSDGSGTAHGRGSLNARLIGLTSIQSWVHRSGNTGTYRYGAANLSAINGAAALILTDVDGDNIVSNVQAGVVISGNGFGVAQGSGTVAFAANADGSGTSVAQTVTNWTDTAITINFDAGLLADTNGFIVVVADDASQGSIAVQAGVPPLTYQESVEALSPDHLWPLDGAYNEVVQALDWSVRSGAPGFTGPPLTRGRSVSWAVTATGQEAGPANSNFMNGQTETTRTMGGWIRLTEVQDSFVMFYEEGGGVNNLAFLMGVGGILIAQFADTSDDNVHAYSDFPLEPNRTYHIAFRFDYNGTRLFELLVDGVVQESTFGNPLTSSDLDAHSGDIAWGDSGDSLEVFGTDINFPAAVTSYFQDWATWTTFITDEQVRQNLFAQGCIGEEQITSGTEAAMQAQLDAYANTTRPNADCVFRVASCVDGDFTLDFDNITFDPGTTFQVMYLGAGTLTLTNLNGSNLDPSKVYGLNGGTVNIVTPSTLTITGLQAQLGGARVRSWHRDRSGRRGERGRWRVLHVAAGQPRGRVGAVARVPELSAARAGHVIGSVASGPAVAGPSVREPVGLAHADHHHRRTKPADPDWLRRGGDRGGCR
jgi:hypothetical protein